MRGKIISLFIAVFLLLTCTFTISAKEFEPDNLGSIKVTLTDKNRNEPIVGAELLVYRIANVAINSNGVLSYSYTNDFKQFDASIDDPALVTKLDAFLTKNDMSSVKTVTDEKGTALCKDLELGLYFVKQKGSVEGFAPCSPFLVSVPLQTENGFEYDVDASPKTEVAKYTSITVKKVWNTSAATKAANSVTVQLLCNGNVIKTATLNEKNNWQITYTDMPESDGYSIKEIDIPKGFTATYKQNGYVFTVTNTSTLIQTGQLIWPIPVLAVSGMLLIWAGVVILKKKRQQNA